jgi:hypothetical protein
MKTIQDLAREGSTFLTTSTRPDGSTFYRLADNAPSWVFKMVHSAHGVLMPDDYRYRWSAYALDAFADYDDPETAISELEAEPYNSQLLAWVASNLSRMDFVDEAISEGCCETLSEALSWGQAAEMREVYCSVLESLVTEVEELAAEEA